MKPLLALVLVSLAWAQDDTFTRIHKEGYCMMRGNGDMSTYHPVSGAMCKILWRHIKRVLILFQKISGYLITDRRLTGLGLGLGFIFQ